MRTQLFAWGKKIATVMALLSIAVVFMLIFAGNVHAADQHPEPGTEFGTGCRWAIDGDGVLWIWPTDGVNGVLPSYTSQTYWPWYNGRASVKKVVVEDGVKTGSGCYGMF